MQTVFHDAQRAHDPKNFLTSGVRKPNPEQPARIDALMGAVTRLGHEVVTPADHGLGPVAAIHTAEYISFLRRIHGMWSAIDGASEEVVPNIHPGRQEASYPASAVGLAGYHMADTACPISADTFGSAYWSAQTALTGADLVLGGARHAYALSRPPGHHAFSDLAGGFCFFNNSAIAAQAALAAGRRPAILDVDLHHGNGTQGIFYARGDVLTVSIHADPAGFYPFFWGHAQERGTGAGLGANLNLPLPRGTSDDGFVAGLEPGLQRVTDFGADFLVVALGLDPFEGDPLAGLGVTTPGFARIAEAIAGLGLPTLIVQEGGYLCPELGANLESFLGGFEAAHR
ncbi:histone deacetylase family protein [Paroceanicella profunda]|uniref:Histone deacetylase family protein n=1 Tax=Paroceanicella profunda TaxID=2579971 RepID=A0A5B8FZC3_9RHOB|nr:histone deacetylase family protein [Paroceanicella profunda]QDL93044.1 histone deacetylase family protein [Paroceanicella profunda]